jgi:hypothetical protein
MHYRINYNFYPESFKRCVCTSSPGMLLSGEHLIEHSLTNVIYLFCYVNVTWDSSIHRTIQKRTINAHTVCISHVLRFVIGTALLLPGKVHGITTVLASRYPWG